MEKKRLIYVSSPYSGAVVEGQVYELLEYYKERNWFEDVLLLQSYSGEEDRTRGEKILEKFSFRRKFFWQNPNYPHLRGKSIKALREVLNDEVHSNTVFHVRGGNRALIVRKALPKGYKDLLILDEFRGLSSSELTYTSKGNFKERIKTLIKGFYLKRCYGEMQKDKELIYSAVSPLLRQVEAEIDGFDINKISVHPNIASSSFEYNEKEKEKIRKELGISNDDVLVVTSSGESGAWQKDLDIIDVLISKGYKVLNLSRKRIENPSVISRFVPHKDMPSYLSACDAALLWRENESLNNVASPSKYSEFACMGLYVIHNKTVDIATRFIQEHNCGLLVDNPKDIYIDPLQLIEEERKRRCRVGKSIFSIEVIANSYFNLLSSPIMKR